MLDEFEIIYTFEIFEDKRKPYDVLVINLESYGRNQIYRSICRLFGFYYEISAQSTLDAIVKHVKG